MAKRVLATVLLALPVLTAGLWLVSGREIFTRSFKTVAVPVRDELFGETFVQEQMVRGPVFGYYIGLDLLVFVIVICLLTWAVAWWIFRRRSRIAVTRSAP